MERDTLTQRKAHAKAIHQSCGTRIATVAAARVPSATGTINRMIEIYLPRAPSQLPLQLQSDVALQFIEVGRHFTKNRERVRNAADSRESHQL